MSELTPRAVNEEALAVRAEARRFVAEAHTAVLAHLRAVPDSPVNMLLWYTEAIYATQDLLLDLREARVPAALRARAGVTLADLSARTGLSPARLSEIATNVRHTDKRERQRRRTALLSAAMHEQPADETNPPTRPVP